MLPHDDGRSAPTPPMAVAGEEIDPTTLEPEQLARVADELDPKTLQGLLADLEPGALATLAQAAGPETAKRILRKIGARAFDLAAIDPAGLDPAIFDTELMALLFKLTPDDRLEAAMSGPLRDVVVAETFRRMPERLNRNAADGVDAQIAWRIGRPDGGHDSYLVKIANGECTVIEGDGGS